MGIIQKEVVKAYPVPFALLLIQVVLALFVVFELLAIIGIDPIARDLSIGLSDDPLEYLFLLLSLALLYLVYSQSQKRFAEVFVATKMLPFMVKTDFSHKLWLAKHEPRAVALVLIQFAFIAAVALTIFAYIDPNFSLVQWDKIGVQPPLTTLLNIIIFLIVVGALYYLYKLTEPYRKATKKK